MNDQSDRMCIVLSTHVSDYIHVYDHYFQTYFAKNRLANQSQIACGAYMGRRNESLFQVSGSYDQHGHIFSPDSKVV